MTPVRAVEFGATEWDGAQPVEMNSGVVLDLYDREHIPLKRYLIYLGVDGDTAAETVQESFLRLHKHLLAGGNQSNLRAWLYRVAHNLARNTQTAFRNSRTGDLAEVNAREEIVDAAATAEEHFLEREKEARFASAMARLSEAQKSCLLLRSQGLKYREIADALSLSVSTVGENVQRGLERLKELL